MGSRRVNYFILKLFVYWRGSFRNPVSFVLGGKRRGSFLRNSWWRNCPSTPPRFYLEKFGHILRHATSCALPPRFSQSFSHLFHYKRTTHLADNACPKSHNFFSLLCLNSTLLGNINISRFAFIPKASPIHFCAKSSRPNFSSRANRISGHFTQFHKICGEKIWNSWLLIVAMTHTRDSGIR